MRRGVRARAPQAGPAASDLGAVAARPLTPRIDPARAAGALLYEHVDIPADVTIAAWRRARREAAERDRPRARRGRLAALTGRRRPA
jgi:hypothetical protein